MIKYEVSYTDNREPRVIHAAYWKFPDSCEPLAHIVLYAPDGTAVFTIARFAVESIERIVEDDEHTDVQPADA